MLSAERVATLLSESFYNTTSPDLLIADFIMLSQTHRIPVRFFDPYNSVFVDGEQDYYRGEDKSGELSGDDLMVYCAGQATGKSFREDD